MENKTIEEVLRENKHRINILAIQKEKLETTLNNFKKKVGELKERKKELKKKAESGRQEDIKKYSDFVVQYSDFAETVDKEREKIESTMRSLYEQDLIKDKTLKTMIRSLVLSEGHGASGIKQGSRPGKFSANRL